MKLLTTIFFSFMVCFSKADFPNDLRWVKKSKEYKIICKTIFELAYKNILNEIEISSFEIIDYDKFLSSLKKSNKLNIAEITCSTSECYGSFINRPNLKFKVLIPKLSNSFIQQIKKNNIEYKFRANLDLPAQNNNYAIVVDLDETILDNSKYQVLLNDNNEKYNPETWSKWVNKEEAELVPGAKNFLKKVRKLGVSIIFLSNRMNKNLETTKRNMDDLEILSDKDIFLLRLNKSDTKIVRRKEIYDSENRMSGLPNFNVISYLGDAYGDFPKDIEKCKWGYNCHLFPNPMYGKW